MARSVLASVFLIACGGNVAGADGGNPGDGGSADGPITPGPGIACGASTCKPASEACCVDKSSRSCLSTVTGDCSGPVFRVQCDDSSDCPNAVCCFTNVLQSAEGATLCTPTCSGLGMVQVCTRTSDCPNSVPCKTYACGGSFGSGTITLGLCAASAPMFCQ